MKDAPIILPNEIVFAEVEDRLARGERVTMKLQGVSMKPFINPGDSFTLIPFDGKLQENQDVVLFRLPNGFHILHRVVGRVGDRVRMRGDNTLTGEEVPVQNILAKVVEIKKPGGVVYSYGEETWTKASAHSLKMQKYRSSLHSLLGYRSRRILSPLYFVCLALLMWLPMGFVPLDNFVFGIRMDHLVHASVYIPCSFFLMDWILNPSKYLRKDLLLLWLAGVGVGILTEGVQYLLPYRGFDINDLCANIIGVTLGWAVIGYHKSRRKFQS